MNRRELINEVKSKLEEYLPTLKKNNNKNNIKDALSYNYDRANDTIVKIFTYSEREQFEAPIKSLLNEKFIMENYSEEYIQKQIIYYYHKILQGKSELDDIESLISSLLDKPIKNFSVISEIENIRIIDNQKYELINSTIKILELKDLLFKKEEFNILNHRNFELLNKPCIFTKIQAGESEKAKELALHNFMVSFNLLKLYTPNFKPVLKGCLLSGNQQLIVFNENEMSLSHDLSKTGNLLLNHAYLSKKGYNQLKELGIEELRRITPISKVVKECLYWYGLGLEEKHPSARLLNFVTVLESSLKKESEQTELRRSVSERGAIFLYDKFEQRKIALKQLKTIYDQRSKVIHTGTLINDNDLSSLAGGYAREILIKLIKMSKQFGGNFEKFIDYLDNLKLGGDSKK